MYPSRTSEKKIVIELCCANYFSFSQSRIFIFFLDAAGNFFFLKTCLFFFCFEKQYCPSRFSLRIRTTVRFKRSPGKIQSQELKRRRKKKDHVVLE